MMKNHTSVCAVFIILALLNFNNARASSLESIAAAVGGQSTCNTFGTRPPISTIFGGYFQIGTTGNGISDCGLQGSIQDNTAAKGPLTTTNSVSANVGGGSYTGSSSATSDYGLLKVTAHGNMLGVTNTLGFSQSGGFSIFNDQLTFNSVNHANGSSGQVVYTFTIGGALTTPVPSPGTSQNIANLIVKQNGFSRNIFTANTFSSTTGGTGTILGNPSYPGFTTAIGSVQGSGQFSSAAIPFVWGKASDLTVGLAAVSFPVTGATLDALLTASLSGISVYDNPGNLLNDFNISSVSGATYTAGGVSSVPIPAAVWLFGFALSVFAGFCRKPSA
jgi:hypothetical protein